MEITTSYAPVTSGTNQSNHLIKITVGDGDSSVARAVNGLLHKYKFGLFNGMEVQTNRCAGSGWERITYNFNQWPHGWMGAFRIEASLSLDKGMTYAEITVLTSPNHPAHASLATEQ